MGVTGLWKLIEPCGKPVPVETLEGKILAVDISIWLHQVVKGFQDNKGSALNNAHLLGLFHRLCKLLYYRVRPVFIFDGCVPQLKRDTIAKRQQQRSKLNNEADRIQALLLQSLAKEQVVQQALGANAELLMKSPVKRNTKASNNADNSMDDMFKLPELPAAPEKKLDSSLCDDSYYTEDDFDDDYMTTTDSSCDESTARHAYNNNLQQIDVRSAHFQQLPADVRHEILTDIKETRKQSSWGRLHELPSRSDDFCTFQMKRLLKRRAVQENLEKAEEEMGGATITYAELSNFFNEEGIVTSAIAASTRQISSDENTRFLLVRDLKKKIANDVKMEVKCETIKEEEVENEKKVKSEVLQLEQTKTEVKPELGTEYDADLQLAIALSLGEQTTTTVYDEKDYEYESNQNLKLSRKQSKQLRDAAKGPARAYMIEYGGMNEEEVDNILEKTQAGDINDTAYLERLFDISQNCDGDKEKKLEAATALESLNEANNKKSVEDISLDTEEILTKHSEEKYQKNHDDDDEQPTSTSRLRLAAQQKELIESQELNLHVTDNSDTDSDFEEVTTELESTIAKPNSLNIVLDLKEPLAPQDDLFADIFEAEETIEIKDSEEIVTDIIELKDSEELLETANNDDAAKMRSILDELKQQTADIKNIKLDEIKLSDTHIEISDDERPEAPKIVKTEVIEICDDIDLDDKQRPILSKSPKTPSKNKSITEYFETNYYIKRTPDKPKEDEQSPVKVKSPFFVQKTPKSARKRAATENANIHSDDATTPGKKPSKAAKTLFETEVEATEAAPKQLSKEEMIMEAAATLKAQKTDEELDTMAKELAAERRELEAERNRQDRMGMSINQRMTADCQELLRLFGVPFIVAPMEAEAQCAFLNAIELTNGTITDDSDIWLFGGRTVYKNFFAQNKHVMEFRADQIERIFNCDRKKLIQLACLVGSDYTTGVHGIGAVTALEILASFATTSQTSTEGASTQNVIVTLQKFRDWWQAQKQSNMPPGSSARLSLRKKLKNIELHEGFPSVAVVEAYLTPKIDDNKEAFSWGCPDVESLREFTRKTFGWTKAKTDDILMPVMKKINDKKTQGSLLNYFSVKSALSMRELKVSKRVQTAIDKMSGKIDVETPEKPVKKPTKRKTATRTKKSKAETETMKETNEMEQSNSTVKEIPTEPLHETASVSMKPRKCARLPNTKEVIPQRERDLEEMRKNKEKAAEILKKAKATNAPVARKRAAKQ